MGKKYQVNSRASLRHSAIGDERRPLLTVDQFIHNPDELVREAVEVYAQVENDRSYFPGIRFPVSIDYQFALLAGLGRSLEKVFDVNTSNIKSIESYFSIVNTKPSKLTDLQKIPHFDFPLTKGLAAIHYLCNEGFGGTSFYKHNQTGYEYIDEQRFANYQQVLSSELESRTLPDKYIVGSNELFTKVGGIDARFNAISVYKGSSLHSGDISSGYNYDSPILQSRLTITSFIHFR